MGDVQLLREPGEGDRSRPIPVAKARALAAKGSWREAWAVLAEVDDLEGADLELRGTIAYLIGDARSYFEDLAAAFRTHDDPASAARCAAWLGIMHLIRGEAGHSAGWMTSARRLVDEHGECAASAYLEVMPILGDSSAGRDQAIAIASEVNQIARRHDDPDAVALTGQTLGHLLIRTGRADEGRDLMDESMVSATSRRLSSPLVEILVYLAVMAGCRLLLDVTRAREWTTAIGRLRAHSPELAAFGGILALCRAELLHLDGDWRGALANLDEVTDRPLLGEAAHLRGEILRHQGHYDDAATAYSQASGRGRDTTAGIAQLHLARGEDDLARSVVIRSLAERTDACDRAVLLPIAVAAVAPTSVDEAAALAEELTQIAALLASPLLEARAQYAAGLVALHRGDASGAVKLFRQAGRDFVTLGVPAEVAASHSHAAAAYLLQGDPALAEIESAAAVSVTNRLGMPAPTSARPPQRNGSTDLGGIRLSARELEVLRLVAAGATNRAIAQELTLSPRTVDRHVSNILTKIGVTSRSAAAAFAVERGVAR